MTKLLGLAWLALLSACSVKQVDPCAGVAGSCLSLRVTGSGDVDTLSIQASSAFTGTMASTFDKGVVALPVRVAVIPKPGASGTLELEVTGTKAGAFVGAGSTSATLTGTNDRQALEVHLTRSDVDGSASQDGGQDADVPDGGSCVPNEGIACTDTMTLTQCNAAGTAIVTTSCNIACSTSGTPHCAVLVPHAPITSAIITSAPQQGIVNLTGTLSIDTDTGQIGSVRAANTNPAASEVISSVEFHQIDGSTSVFSAQAFTFAAGSNVAVVGSRPLMMVATQTIQIEGILDARAQGTSGHCSGGVAAGGFAGGSGGTPVGSGPGGGGAGASSFEPVGSGGGGGGGNATIGGVGGKGYYNGMFALGGTAGFTVILAYPIVGGSGGGAGSPGGTGGTAGLGGAGGGAVQLVAGQSITIVGSSVPVGVLASGCGGLAGTGGGSPGGGGAGGTVLLESPSITFGTYGAVAANGGGGGGGGSAPDQSDLRNDGTGGGAYDAANGMADSGGYGTGGASTGLSPDGFGSTTTNIGGGGGGGGGGYVLLYDLTGMATMQTQAFASPSNSMSLVNGVITYE